MSTTELNVPDIGDFAEVEVIEVLVAVGDSIKAEQSLVTVESDKASMEIPAAKAGVVKAVLVKVGDKITDGSALVQIEEAAPADDPKAAPASPGTSAPPAAAKPAAGSPAAGTPAAGSPAAAKPASA